MSWLHFVVRASFLGGLLFSVLLSADILLIYARRAVQGSREQRWLGRHITAIAASHLLLLAWATARFVTNYEAWSWPWAATLGAIILLSDWSLWQIHLYRRWRDSRAAAERSAS